MRLFGQTVFYVIVCFGVRNEPNMRSICRSTRNIFKTNAHRVAIYAPHSRPRKLPWMWSLCLQSYYRYSSSICRSEEKKIKRRKVPQSFAVLLLDLQAFHLLLHVAVLVHDCGRSRENRCVGLVTCVCVCAVAADSFTVSASRRAQSRDRDRHTESHRHTEPEATETRTNKPS